jgi:hypothetical protein
MDSPTMTLSIKSSLAQTQLNFSTDRDTIMDGLPAGYRLETAEVDRVIELVPTV